MTRPSDAKVEIGIIGAGWWACRNHIPALLGNPYVSSVAINRPDAENLGKAAHAFGLKHAYLEARDMLADRPLDGVIIASPHVMHAEHAMMCLDRNLPLLIEKPMATSARDAAVVTQRAAAQGTDIIIAYGWNFSPVADAARALIRDGWVGEVRHVLCHMATSTAALFAGQTMHRTAQHLFQPAASTWADPGRAGGFGWGQLSHALGFLFLLIDAAPLAAFARMRMSPTGSDWYDAGIVELANGASVTLSGAAGVPEGGERQLDLRLFGTEGMLLVDFERQRVEARRNDGRSHAAALAPGAAAYSCIEPVNRLVDACRGIPIDNPAGALIGCRSVQVLDAIYRSAASGRMEPVDA